MKKHSISQRLKQWLTEHNAKQSDILLLAKPYCKMYGIALNKNDLSQYISGKTEPGSYKMLVLTKALSVSTEWLMGYEEV